MALRKQSNDPGALTSELVSARESYNATVQSVITRASERIVVTQQAIDDLAAEQGELKAVVASAQE